MIVPVFGAFEQIALPVSESAVGLFTVVTFTAELVEVQLMPLAVLVPIT